MKSIAFSVPIYKYKVQNWNIKKTQLLDLFHSFNLKWLEMLSLVLLI